MSLDKLKSTLKDRTLCGVWVLCGEESYLIRHYLGRMRALCVPEGDAAAPFNHVCMEGAEVDYAALLEDVRTPPVFAERKLIEWHQADFSRMRERDRASFDRLCEEAKQHPEVTVVFVPLAGTPDPGTPKKPGSVFSHLSRTADCVVFDPASESQLQGWIARHFAGAGVQADGGVCRRMIALCGKNMDILAGETEKMIAYVRAGGRSAATEEDADAVCARNPQSDTYGLSNALLERDAAGAFRALEQARRNRAEPTVLMAQMYRVYADLSRVSALLTQGIPPAEIGKVLRMHEYRAKLYIRCARSMGDARIQRMLQLCREADRSAKRTRANPYTSLDILAAALCER